MAYFNLFARQQERNRQRLREKLVRQRSAVSGQPSAVAGRHLTPALSPDEAEREKTSGQPLVPFTFTARGLGERGSGRDTQAQGRVPARNAEHARALVRQVYPFAEAITVAAAPNS